MHCVHKYAMHTLMEILYTCHFFGIPAPFTGRTEVFQWWVVDTSSSHTVTVVWLSQHDSAQCTPQQEAPKVMGYTCDAFLPIAQNCNCFQEEQKKVADKTLQDICGDMADAPKVRLTTKKLLKGHINKVNSIHFSGDSRQVFYTSMHYYRDNCAFWSRWQYHLFCTESCRYSCQGHSTTYAVGDRFCMSILSYYFPFFLSNNHSLIMSVLSLDGMSFSGIAWTFKFQHANT
jgi:hypothetical protein